KGVEVEEEEERIEDDEDEETEEVDNDNNDRDDDEDDAQTLILPMLAPQTTSPIPSSSTTDSEILELVEILLKRGASPNDPNSYPLTKSCQINNLDMVKLLLKYKADPTIISLQIAIKYNNEPLINLLIESGIKIDNKLITFAESKASVFPQTIELLKTLQLKQLKN
ncbi:319_t:CDS:2, partial [Entrophospora sp. SA101]